MTKQNKVSPVAASVSVPPAQQPGFRASRDELLAAVNKATGRTWNFSELVRHFVAGTYDPDLNGIIVPLGDVPA